MRDDGDGRDQRSDDGDEAGDRGLDPRGEACVVIIASLQRRRRRRRRSERALDPGKELPLSSLLLLASNSPRRRPGPRREKPHGAEGQRTPRGVPRKYREPSEGADARRPHLRGVADRGAEADERVEGRRAGSERRARVRPGQEALEPFRGDPRGAAVAVAVMGRSRTGRRPLAATFAVRGLEHRERREVRWRRRRRRGRDEASSSLSSSRSGSDSSTSKAILRDRLLPRRGVFFGVHVLLLRLRLRDRRRTRCSEVEVAEEAPLQGVRRRERHGRRRRRARVAKTIRIVPLVPPVEQRGLRQAAEDSVPQRERRRCCRCRGEDGARGPA